LELAQGKESFREGTHQTGNEKTRCTKNQRPIHQTKERND